MKRAFWIVCAIMSSILFGIFQTQAAWYNLIYNDSTAIQNLQPMRADSTADADSNAVLRGAITDLQTAADSVYDASASVVSDSLDEIRTGVDSINTNVSSNDTDIANLQTAADTADTGAANVVSDSLDEIRTGIDSINTNVSDNTSNTTTNTSDITNLKTAVDTIIPKVNTNTGNIATNTSDITDLQTAADTADTGAANVITDTLSARAFADQSNIGDSIAAYSARDTTGAGAISAEQAGGIAADSIYIVVPSMIADSLNGRPSSLSGDPYIMYDFSITKDGYGDMTYAADDSTFADSLNLAISAVVDSAAIYTDQKVWTVYIGTGKFTIVDTVHAPDTSMANRGQRLRLLGSGENTNIRIGKGGSGVDSVNAPFREHPNGSWSWTIFENMQISQSDVYNVNDELAAFLMVDTVYHQTVDSLEFVNVTFRNWGLNGIGNYSFNDGHIIDYGGAGAYGANRDYAGSGWGSGWQFDNCVFDNISGIKLLLATAEFNDCEWKNYTACGAMMERDYARYTFSDCEWNSTTNGNQKAAGFYTNGYYIELHFKSPEIKLYGSPQYGFGLTSSYARAVFDDADVDHVIGGQINFLSVQASTRNVMYNNGHYRHMNIYVFDGCMLQGATLSDSCLAYVSGDGGSVIGNNIYETATAVNVAAGTGALVKNNIYSSTGTFLTDSGTSTVNTNNVAY